MLRSLVVEVLQDKPSEKILFRIWREGQQRADAAAGDNASFEMEEDQVRRDRRGPGQTGWWLGRHRDDEETETRNEGPGTQEKLA